MSANNTLTLQFPVKDPSNPSHTITVLTLRRPVVEDQLAVENLSRAMQEITMFANLAQVSPDLIKKLDLYDYSKLQALFTDFLSPSK